MYLHSYLQPTNSTERLMLGLEQIKSYMATFQVGKSGTSRRAFFSLSPTIY